MGNFLAATLYQVFFIEEYRAGVTRANVNITFGSPPSEHPKNTAPGPSSVSNNHKVLRMSKI